MKTIRENLLRRSFDNHVLAKRHNKRQDEMLEEKFSLYQRRIHLMDCKTYFAERRLEEHAKNDLGLVVKSKEKPIESNNNQKFYYLSTLKNCMEKEFTVEPLSQNVLNKNLYEFVFERRSKQYVESLVQKRHLQDLRREKFMDKMQFFVGDSYKRRFTDWPTSENARIHLPPIHRSKWNRSPKTFSPIDM